MYQLHILYHSAVSHLCKLQVHIRIARSPGKSNILHPAARSVRRRSNSLLESRSIQSVDGDEGQRECAVRVLGRFNRVENGDFRKAPI